MKCNIARRAGQAPPVLAMLALLLTVGVVATTPLAMAKYVASGTVSASARVAKWDVKFTTQPDTADTNPTVYKSRIHRQIPATGDFDANPALITTTTTTTRVTTLGPESRTFAIQNNSEVMADITNLQLRYVITDTGAVTVSSGTVASAANSHGAYQLSLNAGGSVTTPATGTYRFPIGATGTFTISIQATDRTAAHPGIRKYRVSFDATQVD